MKKYILIILSLILFVPSINASELERTEENNYGVNKNIEITDNNKYNILNTKYVDSSELVYDYADLLTDEEEKLLKSDLLVLGKKYKMSAIIYTSTSYYSADSGYETETVDFYDYNDFGIDFKDYDGIILGVFVSNQDKYYEFYTFGKTQLYFDDSRYNSVLDSIFPYFKNLDYYGAMNYYINRVDSKMSLGYASEFKNAYVDELGRIKYKYNPPIYTMVVISAIFTLLCYLTQNKKHFLIMKEHKANYYLDQNSINFTIRKDDLISSHTTSHIYTSSSSGGGHSGGSHSSSGSSGHSHSSSGGRHF